MFTTMITTAEQLKTFIVTALAEKGMTLEDYVNESTPTTHQVILWIFADIISSDDHGSLSSNDWVGIYLNGLPAMSIERILEWFDGAYSDTMEYDPTQQKVVMLQGADLEREVVKANKIAQARVWHMLSLIDNEQFDQAVEEAEDNEE